jgi:hypothetical protein
MTSETSVLFLVDLVLVDLDPAPDGASLTFVDQQPTP